MRKIPHIFLGKFELVPTGPTGVNMELRHLYLVNVVPTPNIEGGHRDAAANIALAPFLVYIQPAEGQCSRDRTSVDKKHCSF